MEFALNAMRNAGPGAQAMSLTPDRGQEGNTLARLPSPLPHTATIRTPLPISRPGAYAGAYRAADRL